jgi:hypothetical protein
VVQPGISYELTVTAAAKDTLEHTNSAIVVITPKRSGLVAAVGGGNLRRVGVDDPIVVSAAGSHDPDDTFGRGAGALTFQWSCTNKKTGSACLDAVTSSAIELATTASISLNHQSGSWLRFNTSYELSVLVCAKDAADGCAERNATAVTVVEVRAGSPPEVGISYCALEAGKLVCGKPVPVKVNPSEKFILEASIVTTDESNHGVISTEWTEVQDRLSVTPSYFSTPLSGAVGAAQLGMVLNNGVMVAKGEYTFRFEATNIRTGAAGLAQIQIVANAPPSSGSVVAAACPVNSTGVCNGGKIGYATETDFVVSSLYWVDDAEDLPLTYSFGFIIMAEGIDAETQQLGHRSSSNRLQSQFPLGNITVVGTAYDRLGASAEGRDEVVVTIKPGADTSALVDSAASALAGMLEQADGEQVTRSVNMLAVLLNNKEEEAEGSEERVVQKRRQRASLLNSTLYAQALMEVSPRAIGQQTGTMSLLVAAPPAELSEDCQRMAIEFSASLVQGSAEVGLAPGGSTAQAVGNTISSVMQAGLLNDTHSERAASASAIIRVTLQNLSAVMLAPAVAGEVAVEVHAPALSLSASRLSALSLSSNTPTPIAMRSSSASGASFVLPANFTLDDSPANIDATLVEWKSSPYAFDSTGSQGAGVISASLKSGARNLNVTGLTVPIELQLPTADPEYWRVLYAGSLCSDTCASASDGTCDDGAAITTAGRRLSERVEHRPAVGDSASAHSRKLSGDCGTSSSSSGPKCAWGSDCADCGRRASSESISINPACTYWHEERGEWSTSGCTIRRVSQRLQHHGLCVYPPDGLFVDLQKIADGTERNQGSRSVSDYGKYGYRLLAHWTVGALRVRYDYGTVPP